MEKNKLTCPLMETQFSIGLVASWFAASAVTLILAFVFIFHLSGTKIINPGITDSNFKLYTALPETESFISQEIVYADGRAKIIEDFFKNYKSPLSEQNQLFIEIADKYQLDYRLLPAISMQESNGGRKIIEGSYNPFGYGIYGISVIRFRSWEEAIERVGRALREDYLNQGLETPEQIMIKYTPPSLAKDGPWAKGVISFMEELR